MSAVGQHDIAFTDRTDRRVVQPVNHGLASGLEGRAAGVMHHPRWRSFGDLGQETPDQLVLPNSGQMRRKQVDLMGEIFAFRIMNDRVDLDRLFRDLRRSGRRDKGAPPDLGPQHTFVGQDRIGPRNSSWRDAQTPGQIAYRRQLGADLKHTLRDARPDCISDARIFRPRAIGQFRLPNCIQYNISLGELYRLLYLLS